MASLQDQTQSGASIYGAHQSRPRKNASSGGSADNQDATVLVQENVRAVLQRAEQLIPARRHPEPLKLIFGIGGGELSHVLLHVLAELREQVRLEVAVAYINLNNSPFSSIEEQFVRRLAERYEVPLGVIHPTEEELANFGPRNSWTVRNHLVEQLRLKHHAHFSVTAQGPHERAEHFLRLLVSGMTATELITIGPIDRRRRILRPLLAVPHCWVRSYSSAHQLKFIPDGGTLEPQLSVIRDRLLPFLERNLEPGIVTSLNAMADRIVGDEEQLWLEAAEHFDRAEADTLAPILDALSPALQWRLLALLAEEQIGKVGRQLDHLSLITLADKIIALPNGGWTITLGDDAECTLTNLGELKFRSEIDSRRNLNVHFIEGELLGGARDALPPLLLKIPGVVVRSYDDGSAVSFEARIVNNMEQGLTTDLHASGNPYSMARAYFSIDKILKGTLTIRERRAGDRIQIGEKKSVRVKRLFEEHGVPSEVSERIPLATINEKILWVPGIAASLSTVWERGDGAALELSYRRRDR